MALMALIWASVVVLANLVLCLYSCHIVDWEYPGKQGAGCNAVDEANDVKNYLQLIKEMRQAFDGVHNGTSRKEITIAGYVRPFESASDFGSVLDRINLMTYDINGAWNDTTGPNAPFQFQPGFGDADSFVSAIEAWKGAGVPAEKIVPGVAFYGRSSSMYDQQQAIYALIHHFLYILAATVDMTQTGSQYQPQEKGKPPKGDSYDAAWQDPNCAKGK